MRRQMLVCAAAVMALVGAAPAQYPGWGHAGSVFILTTPEGANLPAAAAETNFPVLVRLQKDFFDFTQAKPGGADVRFASAAGEPLVYQIEEWDAANGSAAIWVRVPLIKGNARQELKVYWGKADATSESRGPAVFNAENGFLSVMHLSDPADPMRDELGTLTPADVGTISSPGIIGAGRRLAEGNGIKCGENIVGFPTNSEPHTSELWFRAEAPNTCPLGWGNEHAQGKVTMTVASPPHVRLDCYFSNGNVAGHTRLGASEWVHVAHSYQSGSTRLYVNGVLDDENNAKGSPLAIKSPAKMWLGGWYGHFRFVGDLDEVRISKVARSADWVKLEYENQKPMQTLVGPLVPAGSEFSVSESKLTVSEGQSATVSATAGGAQKIYWVLKRDGREAVVATDRLRYTFDAGRVVGNQSLSLQFRAVYAGETKTREIPVTVKEDIPEPVVTLKAPARWDGRSEIEVVPTVANLDAMRSRNAAALNWSWDVSDVAVIKKIAPDKLILKRAQNSGKMLVTATVDNGGAKTICTAAIQVTEPARDAWVQRTPAPDEKPVDNQFFARDDHNEGTLYYNGTLTGPGNAVFLKVYAGDKLCTSETQKLRADKSYSFTVKLKPGLIKYRVEFGSGDKVLHTVTNLVCGDAYIIEGQSNALATDTGDQSPAETSEWICSYGRPAGPGDSELNLWCYPVWKARQGEKAELGWWGMELAKRLVASQKVPVCIINGAVGGTRIDQHQRSETDPTDLKTIYGRLLWRVQQAKLTHGIRAVLWHQGESDQGSDGPTGKYGWETYQQFFVDMSAAWKEDFPNIQHYYIYQIWPNACAMGGGQGSGDRLREVQRTLPRNYSNMSIMSTLGIKPPGGCHYPLTGWAEFARLIQPLMERDLFGKTPSASITPPDLRSARYTSDSRDEIALEFDQPVVWCEGLVREFYLDGEPGQVASGSAAGNVIKLKLNGASAAGKITYLKERDWSQDRLIFSANGIAALTFCNVPIEIP